jgi:hypothetical protein
MTARLPASLRLPTTRPGASKKEVLVDRLKTAGEAYIETEDAESLKEATLLIIEADTSGIEKDIPHIATWSTFDLQEFARIKQLYIREISELIAQLFIDNREVPISLKCKVAAELLADWRHLLEQRLPEEIMGKTVKEYKPRPK